MSGNRRHAGGMKSAMANLKKIDEQIAARAVCAHRKILWAADGVDGVCKDCGATMLPPFKSLPRQSD